MNFFFFGSFLPLTWCDWYNFQPPNNFSNNFFSSGCYSQQSSSSLLQLHIWYISNLYLDFSLLP
ncbi:hypothetical protein QUC31_010154 [Theobroma cacao]